MDEWILFEICVNLFQGALMVYFMRRHVHVCRGNRLTDAACVTAVGLFFTAHHYFALPFTDTAVFLLPMAYAFYLSDDAWYFKIFWTLVLAAIFGGITNAVLILLMTAGNATWPELMARTGMRLAYIGASNAALALAIYLLSRHPRSNGPLSWTALGIFVALNGIFVFIINQLFAIRSVVPEAGLHFLLANACLLVCLFLSLLLYEILSTYAEKQEEAESELRALQLTHQYNAEIQEMYDQMLAWRHDAKNQIATHARHDRAGRPRRERAILGKMAGFCARHAPIFHRLPCRGRAAHHKGAIHAKGGRGVSIRIRFQLPAAHGYQRFLRGAGKFAGQCLDSGAEGPARTNEGLCEAAVCPRV